MVKMDEEKLLHASALRLGRYGVLVTGRSGAGKSVVTLALIERAPAFSRAAALVSDDYVELYVEAGILVAHAPPTIRGAIEIRGAGLFCVQYQHQVRLNLVVELAGEGERYPGEQLFHCLGVELPLLKLPEVGKADVLAICHAIEAHLFKRRWVSQEMQEPPATTG